MSLVSQLHLGSWTFCSASLRGNPDSVLMFQIGKAACCVSKTILDRESNVAQRMDGKGVE